MSELAVAHRHGRYIHEHPHQDAHRQLRHPLRSEALHRHRDHDHDHGHTSQHHGHRDDTHHDEQSGHGHSHGLLDRSILRSRAGVKAVALSLAILCPKALAQLVIFTLSHSVALLADLIHNTGDALTAIPLGTAFFLRSVRGERLAGLAVVLAIFVSACVALYATIMRFIHPQDLTHLWALAAAGLVGFLGNELAAQVGLRAGRRLQALR